MRSLKVLIDYYTGMVYAKIIGSVKPILILKIV